MEPRPQKLYGYTRNEALGVEVKELLGGPDRGPEIERRVNER